MGAAEEPGETGEATRKDSVGEAGKGFQSTLKKGSKTLIEEGQKTLAKATGGATEQTVEAVRWIAKRKQFTLAGIPYGFTGLPIFYYSPNTGWNYGARLQLADYRRLPYRYKLTFHTLDSTQGRSDTYFRFKVPHISDTGFGLVMLLSDKRDIRARYYGRGNDSRYEKEFTDPQSPRFRDENYYYYILREPRFIFSLLRHLWGPFNASIVLGLESTDISPRGETSHYLYEGTPDGVKDGVTGFVGATLSWDSRDDEAIPRRGILHEWSYETSRNSVIGLFFEEIDFRRYTFTDARYWPLNERLNLAHRMVFEVLSGSVPLYAYGEIGGQKRIKGLGGGDSLRGYDTQRFTDNVRFFTNTELRYHFRSMRFYRQYLELHGVLFVDTGRVWSGMDALTLNDFRFTAGTGLRIYWNADFVIRLGIGFSPEQTYTPIKYRNLF
jgi:outer membrane protein assembly factor BamA